MESFLWLCIVLAALWWLGLQLARHLQGLILLLSGSTRIASIIYDLLVFPGVVLHELCHALFALITGVRIMRIDLFRFRRLNDARQGEVVVAHTDPVRLSLIGAAPLFGGIGALLLLMRWLDPPQGFDAILAFGTLLRDPRSALGLYLVVAIANTMFPSEADRKAWPVVGLVLLIGGALLLAFGVRPSFPPQWVLTVTEAIDRLRTTLLPVLLIDVICVAILLALETIVSRVRGRRVVYRSLR